jgi:hypothetical protein
VQLRSEKLGTPELCRFFLELSSVIAKCPRQRPLCRRPRSAKRPHFVFFHIDKHTHTYIYTYPQVHTHRMYPQVQTHQKSIETSPQIHKMSQIQRNKFRTWSTKSKGLRWVLVRWERWDGRLEDLLTTWSLLIRTRRERLHKGDKIASVRHD